VIRHARQAQASGSAKTFVVADGRRAVGYFSLAVGQVDSVEAPERIRKGMGQYPIPVVLLARLAVDRAYQGQGIGVGMLQDAIRRTLLPDLLLTEPGRHGLAPGDAPLLAGFLRFTPRASPRTLQVPGGDALPPDGFHAKYSGERDGVQRAGCWQPSASARTENARCPELRGVSGWCIALLSGRIPR